MSNIRAVCKREFSSYFTTPVGYVVVGVMAVICGLAFTISFIFYAKVSQSPGAYGYNAVPDFEEMLLSPYLVFCGTLFMFMTPLITMRLIAEERHRGTIELLLTQPLRDREIIFGKYLAAMGMVLVCMLFIGVNMVIVGYFVDIEPAVLVFGLFAVVLMAGAYISLGFFVSAVASNQISAGTITFGIFLLLYIAGSLADNLPAALAIPDSIPVALQEILQFGYTVFSGFVRELALDAHAKEMTLGIVSPVDIVYYVLFAAFFLFLTFRALESRHWRG